VVVERGRSFHFISCHRAKFGFSVDEVKSKGLCTCSFCNDEET